MATESKLQSQIAKWLKEQGCFVMVLQPHAGIPSGTADVFFCKEGFYGFIEVKAAKTSPFQPLQKEFVAKMDKWSWAKVAHPTNWPDIRAELSKIL